MITYKLAKQLKDAGFPQEGKGVYETEYSDYGGVYFPTLSELIEACGHKMFSSFSLEQHSNDWRAGNYRSNNLLDFCKGSTPEEAVAKLWLELNK